MIPFAPISDIKSDQFLTKSVNGQEVGAIKYNNQYYVYHSICPHAGASICKGSVQFKVISQENQVYEVDKSILILSCPWHGHEFFIDNGRSVLKGLGKLARIPSAVIDGILHVDL